MATPGMISTTQHYSDMKNLALTMYKIFLMKCGRDDLATYEFVLWKDLTEGEQKQQTERGMTEATWDGPDKEGRIQKTQKDVNDEQEDTEALFAELVHSFPDTSTFEGRSIASGIDPTDLQHFTEEMMFDWCQSRAPPGSPLLNPLTWVEVSEIVKATAKDKQGPKGMFSDIFTPGYCWYSDNHKPTEKNPGAILPEIATGYDKNKASPCPQCEFKFLNDAAALSLRAMFYNKEQKSKTGQYHTNVTVDVNTTNLPIRQIFLIIQHRLTKTTGGLVSNAQVQNTLFKPPSDANSSNSFLTPGQNPSSTNQPLAMTPAGFQTSFLPQGEPQQLTPEQIILQQQANQAYICKKCGRGPMTLAQFNSSVCPISNCANPSQPSYGQRAALGMNTGLGMFLMGLNGVTNTATQTLGAVGQVQNNLTQSQQQLQNQWDNPQAQNWQCPVCNATNGSTVKYCNQCGKQQPVQQPMQYQQPYQQPNQNTGGF